MPQEAEPFFLDSSAEKDTKKRTRLLSLIRRPSSKACSSHTSADSCSPPLSPISSPGTPIYINVYDLIPASCIASILWPLGLSLLHTSIVINEREYAYGACSDRSASTGVYSHRAGIPLPGAKLRSTILHGYIDGDKRALKITMQAISEKFLGREYHLIKNNCNHFTDYVCRTLTARRAPRWINRVARFGNRFPALVPDEWLELPQENEEEEEEEEEEEDSQEEKRRRKQQKKKKKPPKTSFEAGHDETVSARVRLLPKLKRKDDGKAAARDAEDDATTCGRRASAELGRN